jgi:hypothetical protein
MMNWHFAIPAVAFLIVSALIAFLQTPEQSHESGRSASRMSFVLIPGTIAAALAWLGYRIVEGRILGSGTSVHFLLKGETTGGQALIPWVGLVYFLAMVTLLNRQNRN